ncbi:Fic family protein [Pseudoalteromonas sp. JC28]|nr:Fic family protein [Pseudoalteromonas sp. JC28]
MKIENILRLRGKFYKTIDFGLRGRELEESDIHLINKSLSLELPGYRTHKSWVGRSENDKIYIPPAPSEIKSLINDTLKIFNKERVGNNLTCNLFLYFRIVAIHPFIDANGRTARSLFLSLVEEKYSLYCPRLHLSKKTEEMYNELCFKSLSSYESFANSPELRTLLEMGKELTNYFNNEKESLVFNVVRDYRVTDEERFYKLFNVLVDKGVFIESVEGVKDDFYINLKKKGVVEVLPIFGRVGNVIISKHIFNYHNKLHEKLIKGMK